MAQLQKLSTCLWFDHEAEQAALHYVSIFRNSRIGAISHYGKEGFDTHGRPAGSVMAVEFELEGRSFTALNGGPHFKFSPAISFQIPCQMQEEIDYYWDKLCAGGQPGRCGWLTDRFGVSWQVFPGALPELLGSPDQAKAGRAMRAMLAMNKIDLAGLRAAAGGNA
ncbi:MAG TPA: VOC family protein [Xanthobacteraceae bacterium]|jgi:predicted 3-demethylubiquinone-9 3-methyltransferase (glyoxalase superfamily)